jgi:hypothetical protein
MKSNFQQIREHGILLPDSKIDRKDWSWDRRGEIVARYKNKVVGNQTSQYREIKPALPSPLEVRLRLQSRMIIADLERPKSQSPEPKKREPLKFWLLVENETYYPKVEKDGEEKVMPLKVVKGYIVGSNGYREEFSIVKRSCNLRVAKIRAKVARVCGEEAVKELQQAIINLYK